MTLALSRYSGRGLGEGLRARDARTHLLYGRISSTAILICGYARNAISCFDVAIIVCSILPCSDSPPLLLFVSVLGLLPAALFGFDHRPAGHAHVREAAAHQG